MVGACPADFADLQLAALCRKDPDDDTGGYSYLMDVPVMSLVTNLTYANVYCARCHSDDGRLAQWDLSVTCSDDYEKSVSIFKFKQIFIWSQNDPGGVA